MAIGHLPLTTNATILGTCVTTTRSKQWHNANSKNSCRPTARKLWSHRIYCFTHDPMLLSNSSWLAQPQTATASNMSDLYEQHRSTQTEANSVFLAATREYKQHCKCYTTLWKHYIRTLDKEFMVILQNNFTQTLSWPLIILLIFVSLNSISTLIQSV